ncbi:hypothetical protein BVY11_28730 [Pseudomonas amygdali pv. morsprunorum]|nr:hypothetical protein BVY11_28730 [Pseudomonas amygdali pv. morsprunorum]
MFMNNSMRNLISGAHWRGKKIAPALLEILTSGFIEVEGCYFLKALYEYCPNVALVEFPDSTGFECFVNSIHVDDYVESDWLVQALLFADESVRFWYALSKEIKLTVIISSDEFGAVVKLHSSRPGEAWLGPNLEGYQDPVLSFETSEYSLGFLDAINKISDA